MKNKAKTSSLFKTKPKRVGITELVLRDGHQSLIATRMKLEDMLPICKTLDEMGFWALEVWGGATFDACIRFLREDPWERLKKLRQALPNSRLQMLLRGRNLLGYRPYGDDVIRAFVASAANYGMDVFRVFDAMNDFDNMKVALQAVKSNNRHAQGTICYTTSPVHTTEGFVNLAERFSKLGCDSIAIKDMAGIMTPEACAELVSEIKRLVNLPIHIHSHYTSGLAALCHLRAVEAGADVVETAISPFAEGASHPATETIHTLLTEMGIETGLDADSLPSLANYFRHVRKKYWQFESQFTAVDPRVLEHHVPGGMISNLTNQLREQGMLDKLDDVLNEIPRVRADLGYPPLVTPTSQMVGMQATLNVIEGERYANISQEIRQYLIGMYGKIPGKVNPILKKMVVADKKNLQKKSAESFFEIEKMKADLGGLAVNKEDVLTYAMFPDMGTVFLQERAANKLRPLELLPIPTDDKKKEKKETPSEYRVTVHGETYSIHLTGLGKKSVHRRRPLYFTVDGVPEQALIEVTEEYDKDAADNINQGTRLSSDGRPQASLPGHVTTNMPGAVVDILVAEGEEVKVGTSVLVIEAMKMENEIKAKVSGKVTAVLVSKGDSVSPGEILLEISEK